MVGKQLGRRSVLGILGAGVAFGLVRAHEAVAEEPPKLLQYKCSAYFWCADEEGNIYGGMYLLEYRGATAKLAKAGLLRLAAQDLPCEANGYSLAHSEFDCSEVLTGECKGGSTKCCKKYTAVCTYDIDCIPLQYTGCGNTRMGAILDARRQAKVDADILEVCVGLRKSCKVTRTCNKNRSVRCNSCD